MASPRNKQFKQHEGQVRQSDQQLDELIQARLDDILGQPLIQKIKAIVKSKNGSSSCKPPKPAKRPPWKDDWHNSPASPGPKPLDNYHHQASHSPARARSARSASPNLKYGRDQQKQLVSVDGHGIQVHMSSLSSPNRPASASRYSQSSSPEQTPHLNRQKAPARANALTIANSLTRSEVSVIAVLNPESPVAAGTLSPKQSPSPCKTLDANLQSLSNLSQMSPSSTKSRGSRLPGSPYNNTQQLSASGLNEVQSNSEEEQRQQEKKHEEEEDVYEDDFEVVDELELLMEGIRWVAFLEESAMRFICSVACGSLCVSSILRFISIDLQIWRSCKIQESLFAYRHASEVCCCP
jgi:hypothetical protein